MRDADVAEGVEALLVQTFLRMRARGTALVVGVRGLGADGQRHTAPIRRGFHDVMVVYPFVGAPFVISASTVAWQRFNAGEGRPAVYLAPGSYVAVPALIDRRGRPSPRGGLTFLVSDPATGMPIDYGTGSIALYPEHRMSPHVGCQTVPNRHWGRFARAVGEGTRPFAYVLVDASTAARRVA